MTITELPPVKRNYKLTVSEDELKIIGVLLGRTKPTDFRRMVETFTSYSGTPTDIGLISNMFHSIADTITND